MVVVSLDDINSSFRLLIHFHKHSLISSELFNGLPFLLNKFYLLVRIDIVFVVFAAADLTERLMEILYIHPEHPILCIFCTKL